MFDAILIDEAQDFYPNFYKMCRDALRDPQRLIWAYDEAQSLENLSAPSPTNIFGKDEAGNPVVDLRGSYPGGIQKSTIMRRSYRAPRAVLMTAHALGMGLKRSDGVVQTITTQDGWENIGYKIVTGDFRKPGTEVQIRRPDENSPHPLQDEAAARPFVDHQSFDSRHTEMAHVATSIREDVNEDDIDPEDIMIILLGQRTEKRAERVARRLDQQLPSDIETNLVWQGDGDVFKQAGKITVTRINRAKGNEAPVVYLTGIEYVDKTSSRDSLVQRRNKAFVGITRSRAWCTITGVDQGQPVFDELPAILEEVTEGDGSLSFSAPDATSLENELERETTRTELDDFGDFSIPDSLQRPSTEFR
jgi:superfamily I DNA and RNA helicase